MNLQRTSRDFESLKGYLKILATQNKDASIPNHMLEWINHLIEVKNLVSIDAGISRFCSWEELQGLILIQEAANAADKMKTCPRCGKKTEAIFDCDKCGARLTK